MEKKIFVYALCCVSLGVIPVVLRFFDFNICDEVAACMAVAGSLGLIFNDKIINTKTK